MKMYKSLLSFVSLVLGIKLFLLIGEIDLVIFRREIDF